jgi:hypothetical protein
LLQIRLLLNMFTILVVAKSNSMVIVKMHAVAMRT